MNKAAKIGMIIGSIIGTAYIVFLAAPLILNPIINSYSPQIKNIIHDFTGLESELENVKLVTTPKLTAGLKVEKFALLEPTNSEIFSANDFQVKMSLLPIFARKIKIDAIQLKNARANILIDKDGILAIEKYFPKNETPALSTGEETTNSVSRLPMGLKLSNHLPDIKIGGYDITITDGVDKYTLIGDKTEITDFVFNKSIKVKASGKAVLKNREQFNYDVKILNKIMPEIELDEFVFNPPQEEEKPKTETAQLDIIKILQGIYDNNLSCNAVADLVIAKEGVVGDVNLTNLSIINLPPSNAKFKFKNHSLKIDSDIYTANNEVSTINGLLKNGKNPSIDLNLKSNVEIANILQIVKKIATIFGIQDLQTLTANGKLNADFNIKSNLKTVKSNGYLQVPQANVYYGLYKIGIDNINADVKLDNNNVNIQNIGFSILNQPLKLYGTITSDAVSDLHLVANQLSLKGLIVAAGQAVILKENQVNSGTVSMKADIQGKLDKINPVVKINLDNINIKNIPTSISLVAPKTVVEADMNEIVVQDSSVKVEKINANVSGKIKDYLTEKIGLDFITSGDIKSTLKGSVNAQKQTLNLNFATKEDSTIIIPMFDKSKLTFTGNVGITGNIMNPILKGVVNVSSLNIPEIPVTMENLSANLNGIILNGNGSVKKFTSGGIVAENLTSDFYLKGEEFYLNNLKGDAFDGKVKGNIIYNMMNAKANINFTGESLNAEKAVYGAIGIKNAISGTLGFDTKLNLIVADYNEMMKSLKGELAFSIKNGSFGSIGRLDKMLQANNIMTNSILKTTTSTLINGVGLADTAKFEYLDGNLNFANGWAELKPIKSSGETLAYYITGKYNLINGTANINLLGRLDAQIVAKLGIVGELSAEKLFAYIPKFGNTTANIVNALTSDPKNEKTELIPALTSGSTNYKDFKVSLNGGLESTSSVKSFKWLTKVDMSAIETKSTSEALKELKTSVSTDYKNTVDSVKEAITTSKEELKNTREQLKNSAEELKNLFRKKSSAE